MAQTVSEEKTTQEKIARTQEKARRAAERQARSAQAMAQGPDVYAKRIIASWFQVPLLHFFYSLFYIAFDFVLGGHFIVKTWRQLLIKAGYISEGALGVASVWALCNHVLHGFLASNSVTNSIIDPMNAFTLGSFTLVPDLILASCILFTFNRYKACKKPEGRGLAIFWALLYTGFAVVFLGLTAYTLSAVSTLAGGGDISKVVSASGMELQIRVLSAYFYGMTEIIYASTQKRQEPDLVNLPPLPVPAQPQIDVQAVVSVAISEVATKLAGEQKEMMNVLSQRLDLQRIENRQALAQVQQPTPVASVDPNTVADLVMQRLEKQIQAMLQQGTTVALIPDATQHATNQPLLDAPKTLQRNTQREAKPEAEVPNNITQLPQRSNTGSTSATGKTALIFALLEKDPTLEVPQLRELASCDRTTAWRALQKWERLQGIVRDATEAETEATNSATSEEEREEDIS